MYHQISNQTTDIHMQSITFDNFNISTFYVDLLNEQALEFFHAHKDTIELYFVLENHLEMHLLDERFPSQRLNQYDFILINSKIGHNVKYSPNEPKKYFVVNFSVSKRLENSYLLPPNSKDEFLLVQYLALCQSECPFFLLHDSDGAIRSIIESIISCSTSRQHNWRLMRRVLYCQLIITLLNCCTNLLRPEKELLSEKNIAIAITQYLHANYQNSQLDLTLLSKEFNFSAKHLVRMFENYFSKTPSKTLTFYRINYAKNYLLNTDWTIDEIAEAVGFSSASSLSRCFKEIENVTITEFREHNRK